LISLVTGIDVAVLAGKLTLLAGKLTLLAGKLLLLALLAVL
jgi:hypothetical protein